MDKVDKSIIILTKFIGYLDSNPKALFIFELILGFIVFLLMFWIFNSIWGFIKERKCKKCHDNSLTTVAKCEKVLDLILQRIQ